MTSNENRDEIDLHLTITEAGADAERIDELTGYLSRDLHDLGAEAVQRAPSEATPEGAKGDPFTLGALALVAVPAFLPKLVEFLQAWSLRGESRTVTIKTPAGLEVEFTPENKLSQDELLALVEKLTAGAQALSGPSALPLSDRNRLRRTLSTYFNEEELRTLCFDLDVRYDNLPGEGAAGKARELIAYLERHGRVNDLLQVGRLQRPDVPWD